MLSGKTIRAVFCAIASTVVLVLVPSSGQAGVLIFDLHNHPDGNAAPPSYGFRLDELFDVTSGHDIFTFDFDHSQSTMQLFYDDGGTPNVLNDDMVTIRGYAYGGLDTGSGYTNPDYTGRWYIDFSYRTNFIPDPNEPASHDGVTIKVGSKSTLNNGTITPIFGVAGSTLDVGDPINLVDEHGSHDYSFKFNNFDDHRLGGTGLSGPDTYVGWGWVNHSDAAHVYSSDWLFTATQMPAPVPEPASIGLFAVGCTALLGFRRRRSLRLRIEK